MKEKECPACHGEKRIFVMAKRLIGATYPFDDPWKGDEHYVPCPLCQADIPLRITER